MGNQTRSLESYTISKGEAKESVQQNDKTIIILTSMSNALIWLLGSLGPLSMMLVAFDMVTFNTYMVCFSVKKQRETFQPKIWLVYFKSFLFTRAKDNNGENGHKREGLIFLDDCGLLSSTPNTFHVLLFNLTRTM